MLLVTPNHWQHRHYRHVQVQVENPDPCRLLLFLPSFISHGRRGMPAAHCSWLSLLLPKTSSKVLLFYYVTFLATKFVQCLYNSMVQYPTMGRQCKICQGSVSDYRVGGNLMPDLYQLYQGRSGGLSGVLEIARLIGISR